MYVYVFLGMAHLSNLKFKGGRKRERDENLRLSNFFFLCWPKKALRLSNVLFYILQNV